MKVTKLKHHKNLLRELWHSSLDFAELDDYLYNLYLTVERLENSLLQPQTARLPWV